MGSGKDVDKRKELKANELVQSKKEEAEKQHYFKKLYQVGIQNMSNIELQNARANGTVDADAEDGPEAKMLSPLHRSRRSSFASAGSSRRSFAGGDKVDKSVMALTKNVSTLKEEFEERIDNMERLVKILVNGKEPDSDADESA